MQANPQQFIVLMRFDYLVELRKTLGQDTIAV
jgi:hypothetical protein